MSKPEIDPDEFRYTMSESASICGVTEMNIRNWMARDVVSVGLKHKLGRWLFNAKDVVRLKVIGDLSSIAGMPPTEANIIADAVVGRLSALTQVDDEGEIVFTKSGRTWERLRVFIFKDGDNVFTRNFMGTSDDYRWAPGNPSEFPWFNRPHLVIPADEICFEVILKLFLIDSADAGVPLKLEALTREAEPTLKRRDVIDRVDAALDEVDEIAELEGVADDKSILEALEAFAVHLKSIKSTLIKRSEKGMHDEK